jgi:hypothetical protein
MKEHFLLYKIDLHRIRVPRTALAERSVSKAAGHRLRERVKSVTAAPKKD